MTGRQAASELLEQAQQALIEEWPESAGVVVLGTMRLRVEVLRGMDPPEPVLVDPVDRAALAKLMAVPA
ncbi:MAG: hypothetical protein ACJ72N_07065 [Labedaea sp.]